MALGLVATVCAAVFVLYYQYRSLEAIQSQARVIFRQISEQTAADIATEVRRTLDGPVFDTLLAVTHPELRDGRLDLVAEQYRRGLHEYPQVQAFFVWSKETEAIVPGEALFYDRASVTERDTLEVFNGARFGRDPALGRTIIDIAQRSSYAQHIYAAQEVGPDRRQVFLRLYWKDASRQAYYAILGYVVSPATLPDMFATLHERSLASLLKRRGGDIPLELRVTDGSGRVVFGRPTSMPEAAGVTVSMEFYPNARIESRLVASGLTDQAWRFEVNAPVPDRGLLQAYWPTGASVLLMLLGFGLTVHANRRADELARMQADFIAYASHQLKTPLSLDQRRHRNGRNGACPLAREAVAVSRHHSRRGQSSVIAGPAHSRVLAPPAIPQLRIRARGPWHARPRDRRSVRKQPRRPALHLHGDPGGAIAAGVCRPRGDRTGARELAGQRREVFGSVAVRCKSGCGRRPAKPYSRSSTADRA